MSDTTSAVLKYVQEDGQEVTADIKVCNTGDDPCYDVAVALELDDGVEISGTFIGNSSALVVPKGVFEASGDWIVGPVPANTCYTATITFKVTDITLVDPAEGRFLVKITTSTSCVESETLQNVAYIGIVVGPECVDPHFGIGVFDDPDDEPLSADLKIG